MKMKKLLSLGAAFMVAGSLMVGCTSTKEEPKEEATETTTTEQTTEETTEATYKAESEADERGYKGIVEITYKDGKISEVVYNEVGKDGKTKKEDEAYNTEMEKVSKISAKDAQIQLEKALVETQDIEKVDTVSGATGTSELFKTLAKEAIAQKK
jgi:major membrane immunogen (membrane-anchored lipoprotein)